MLTLGHERLLLFSAERDKNFLVHFGAYRLLNVLWADKNINTFRSSY